MHRPLLSGLALLTLATTACSDDGGVNTAATGAPAATTTTGIAASTSVTAPQVTDAPVTTDQPAPAGGYTSVIVADIVDNPDLDPFERTITTRLDKAGLPGASLLVVQHGVLVEQEAWGEYDLDTIVPIASASKWLSAATIMTVVEEGLLSLDEPISSYVPQLRGQVGTITLRQLLSFTSGLTDDGRVPCITDPTSTMQDCAAKLLAGGVVHPPGTKFRYGSEHLYLAGALAEYVTGVPFAQLFRERIAVPLGMDHTAFLQSGSGGQYEDVTNPNPAGGAVSTLGDYGRFLEMIVHGGLAPDGTRLLQEASVAEMQTDQTVGVPVTSAAAFRVNEQTPYGLGEWLDWTDEAGAAIVISSDGKFGFRPWIDRQNDLYGVYLIYDNGQGYVDGDPDAGANTDDEVVTSGNWVFVDVAEALGGSLPEVKHPNPR